MIYVKSVSFSRPVTSEDSHRMIMSNAQDPRFSASAVGALALLHAFGHGSGRSSFPVTQENLDELRTVKIASYALEDGYADVILYT